MQDDKVSGISVIITIFVTLALIVGILFGISWTYRQYHVWSAGMTGKAQLNQAEWNRQIVVREAEAKKDAAIMLAQAEIERAKGVAEANRIIGDSLHNNEAYLRYLWIDHLQSDNNKVIYVPTEANLPILEASRLTN